MQEPVPEIDLTTLGNDPLPLQIIARVLPPTAPQGLFFYADPNMLILTGYGTVTEGGLVTDILWGNFVVFVHDTTSAVANFVVIASGIPEPQQEYKFTVDKNAKFLKTASGELIKTNDLK